jgi:hypothetical protein
MKKENNYVRTEQRILYAISAIYAAERRGAGYAYTAENAIPNARNPQK